MEKQGDVMGGKGLRIFKKRKENRSFTQQRAHICLKQADTAETIFGCTFMAQYTHLLSYVMKPGVMNTMPCRKYLPWAQTL